MTREEIEQIIRQNIRTNGRGEISARVMAGVLTSFVEYTDTLSADFIRLCNALADAFTVQVGELEEKFEGKADALEAAFEAFVNDLLNNHFEPWAETLANDLKALMRETKAAAVEASTKAGGARTAAETAAGKADEAKAASMQAKAAADNASDKAVLAKSAADDAKTAADGAKAAIDTAADGIAEALDLIRDGNTKALPFVVPDGMSFAGSDIEEFPENMDFSQITKVAIASIYGGWPKGIFEECENLTKLPALRGKLTGGYYFLLGNISLTDISAVKATFDAFQCDQALVFPEGCITIDSRIGNNQLLLGNAFRISPNAPSVIKIIRAGSIEGSTNYAETTFSGALDKLTIDMSEAVAGRWLNLTFVTDAGTMTYTIPDNLIAHCVQLNANLYASSGTFTIPGGDYSLLKGFSVYSNSNNLECVVAGRLEGLGQSFGSGTILYFMMTASLQSLQNLITGLAATGGVTKRFITKQANANIMTADTTEYEYNGSTYIGLANLLAAKGWTMAIQN